MANDFLLGFACALGSLAREQGHPTMAADIAECNGITFSDLKAAGAEEFDLAPLREEMNLKSRMARFKKARGVEVKDA